MVIYCLFLCLIFLSSHIFSGIEFRCGVSLWNSHYLLPGVKVIINLTNWGFLALYKQSFINVWEAFTHCSPTAVYICASFLSFSRPIAVQLQHTVVAEIRGAVYHVQTCVINLASSVDSSLCLNIVVPACRFFLQGQLPIHVLLRSPQDPLILKLENVVSYCGFEVVIVVV